MVKAYVLINLVTTDLPEVINEIRSLKNVKFADAITGPYDAICLVESQDISQIGAIITDKILKIKGVAKTLTCVAV
jgi:DNA-binding Lrp family transcriptional regulator